MPPIKTQRKRSSNGSSIEVASVLGAGTSKIKKKIRDIERLLAKKRDKMPANVIVENERALAALKTELENAEYVGKVKRFSKKYHMVRFFEKKKALRKYKQVKKEYDELERSEEGKDKKELKKELKKLRKKLSHAEVDLAYVVNFPRDRKYIALYPNENEDEELDPGVKKGLIKTEEQKQAFKKEIEQLIKEQSLPVSIEDILSGKKAAKVTSNNSKFSAPDAAQDYEEEEDDFFE